MTTTKLTAGLALGLVATVAASSPALAATPKHENATGAKVERIMVRGGSKAAPSAKGVKAVKRQLKRAGMKRGHAAKTKRVNRSYCSITYYSDGAIAVCQDDIYSWWNDVYVDFYNDYSGWIYWGFFVN